MPRMSPLSLSRRTRFSVAAGDRPTMRASSTLVRSASSCSSVSSWKSISSSSTAMRRNNIPSSGGNQMVPFIAAYCDGREQSSCPHRTHRRRARLGTDRAADQGRPRLAGPCVDDGRALRARRPAAGAGRAQAPARGRDTAGRGMGRGRLRRCHRAPERRHRAHERQPCGGHPGRGPGPRRTRRRRARPRQRGPAGLGRLRRRAGRHRARRRFERRRVVAGRRADPRLGRAVGGDDRRAGVVAPRPRRDRRHRRADGLPPPWPCCRSR